MNPFANPEESITYEYVEFPRRRQLRWLNLRRIQPPVLSSISLHFMALPPESTPSWFNPLFSRILKTFSAGPEA